MFYIKTKINDDSCITTTITEANVFTTCIDCGAEVPVTLDDMIVDGHLDLFGISCHCEECSYRYAMKHRSEPWAEQIAADYLARKKERAASLPNSDAIYCKTAHFFAKKRAAEAAPCGELDWTSIFYHRGG